MFKYKPIDSDQARQYWIDEHTSENKHLFDEHILAGSALSVWKIVANVYSKLNEDKSADIRVARAKVDISRTLDEDEVEIVDVDNTEQQQSNSVNIIGIHVHSKMIDRVSIYLVLPCKYIYIYI